MSLTTDRIEQEEQLEVAQNAGVVVPEEEEEEGVVGESCCEAEQKHACVG